MYIYVDQDLTLRMVDSAFPGDGNIIDFSIKQLDIHTHVYLCIMNIHICVCA